MNGLMGAAAMRPTPATAGSAAEGPVRCPNGACRHVLGIRLPDGRIEMQHRGRRIVGRLDEIACECCRTEWRRDRG